MRTYILLAELSINVGDEYYRRVTNVYLETIKAQNVSDAHSKHKHAIGDEVGDGVIEELKLLDIN